MAAAPVPWLLADVGGTRARFGWVAAPDESPRDVLELRCADFPQLADALAHYLQHTGLRPRVAGIAVAAPVEDDRATLTNRGWALSGAELARSFGLASCRLFNDFEALALALPRLPAEATRPLGGGTVDRRRTMAVIGPGTGLGVAACVPVAADRWIALPGEGGHATLAAADDLEADVLRALRADRGHISAERALSGIGLPALHRAVLTVRHGRVGDALRTPEDITAAAIGGHDADCAATLDLFAAMLGGFAGNVALTLGARGGVFIAGGIAQLLADYLPRSRLRARFEDKGRFRAWLAPIATPLIVAPHVALTGVAHALGADATDPR